MVANTNTSKPPQWLALHFPHLALDQHNRGLDQENQDKSQAISDRLAGRQCIVDFNQAAEHAGICIGMPVAAALSLLDSLQVSVRDPRTEQAALKRLAGWCYQYSSQVCIDRQHNSLLLEVAASERLFGHAEKLAGRITMELEQLGYRAVKGIAPTPEAARLAARHGLHIHVAADIRKSIGALDIDSLNLKTTEIKSLQKMGFRTVTEVFRLPRKALARRMGPAVSDYLDRLLGHRPEPCKTFLPPDSFSAGMDLPDTEHTQGLIFPLKRLVQELCGVLRAHDRGIQVLQVRLRLDEGAETMRLTLQQTTRSEAHLMMLLGERLERLQLPRPVRHIRLQALHFLPCAVVQTSLFKEIDTSPADTGSHVIERLRARLGTESVKGISGLEDHRPEYSWSLRELDEPATYTAQPGRPAWLLPRPQLCQIDNYHILTGPERIETGWWDGRDCRRDYFIVRDANGSTLWAFHEYKPHPGWYLHGLFA
ncbi:MAG: DNA polymerase Y family protein [Xanthomonadales bacterium]|nr:DNA polymerase Y family protein [Xanthomonadales bacterium]